MVKSLKRLAIYVELLLSGRPGYDFWKGLELFCSFKPLDRFQGLSSFLLTGYLRVTTYLLFTYFLTDHACHCVKIKWCTDLISIVSNM